MAWSPITGAPLQYQKSDGTLAADYYLKFYADGTPDPISMATDSTGLTTLDKAKINSSGNPVNGSDGVFIPHIDQDYKLVLFKNETDADNNDTANADWVVDNISQFQSFSRDAWVLFTGTPTQTSATTFTLTGDQTSTFTVGTRVRFTDASTLYGIVSASAFTTLTTVTVVLDTGSLSGSLSQVFTGISTTAGQEISSATVSSNTLRTGAINRGLDDIISENAVSVKAHGAKGDGVTDDSAAIQSAIDVFEDLEGEVYFPEGTYIIDASVLILGKILLRGAGMFSTTIKLIDDATATGSNLGYIFDTFSRSNITITDMAFDGNIANQSDYNPSLDNGQSAIVCRNSSDITINRCFFKEMGKDGVLIFDVGTTNERIHVNNCLFENIYRFGVTASSVKHLNVRGCTFQGGRTLSDASVVSNGGVTWEADNSGETLEGLTVNDCDFIDMKAGIRITNLVSATAISGINITGNRFHTIDKFAAVALYQLGNAEPLVSSNVFYDCGSNVVSAALYELAGGVGYQGTDGTKIIGNNFVRCGGTRGTIYCDEGGINSSIQDNTFIDDGRSAIFLQTPDGAGTLGTTGRQITGNICLNGSQDAANTYEAIRVSNSDTGATQRGGDYVDSNTIQTSSTTGYSHGIRVFGDDGTTVLGSNVISGTGIDILVDGGSNEPIREFESFTSTSAACTGALTNSLQYEVRKFRDQITISIPLTVDTTTDVADITLGATLPARFRPSANTYGTVLTIVNNSQQNQPGQIVVESGGTIIIYRDPSQTTWGTAASTGFQKIQITYVI